MHAWHCDCRGENWHGSAEEAGASGHGEGRKKQGGAGASEDGDGDGMKMEMEMEMGTVSGIMAGSVVQLMGRGVVCTIRGGGHG